MASTEVRYKVIALSRGVAEYDTNKKIIDRYVVSGAMLHVLDEKDQSYFVINATDIATIGGLRAALIPTAGADAVKVLGAAKHAVSLADASAATRQEFKLRAEAEEDAKGGAHVRDSWKIVVLATTTPAYKAAFEELAKPVNRKNAYRLELDKDEDTLVTNSAGRQLLQRLSLLGSARVYPITKTALPIKDMAAALVVARQQWKKMCDNLKAQKPQPSSATARSVLRP